MIAMRNPQAHPERTESIVQLKRNNPAPTEEKIFENPILINQANNKPRIEPSNPATLATNTPSCTASALASAFFRPRALIVPISSLRDSESIIIIVRTSNIPAAMVNEPKTRNIAAITPLVSAAASADCNLTGDNMRLLSSIVDLSSNHI